MIAARCGRHDRHRDGSGRRRVPCQWSICGTCELDCPHQASEWTNDKWASQVMGGNTRRPKLCMRICSARLSGRLSPPEQALIRSQGGPMSGVRFTCFPVSRECRIDSSSFRVLLLRRLWLSLPPSSRNCRCGLPLDSRGHYRACSLRAGWGVGSSGARS